MPRSPEPGGGAGTMLAELPAPAELPPGVAHGGSGVCLMPGGLEAFAARVQAARGATTRLDLQYYIWRGDLTGSVLAQEVLHVADRGVQVRVLLDDMYAIGRERVLVALDAHPNIEVRLFNATRWRRFGQIGLMLEILFGGWHLNRRMHNKAWIADGRVAICGGRNIGDEYFDASGEFNFRDLDLVIAGGAAGEAQRIFERYWHHRLARPVAVVTQTPHRRGGLKGLAAKLQAACAAPQARPFFEELGADAAVAEMMKGDPSRLSPVGPADIRVLADPPDKARGRAPAAECLAPAILEALRRAKREALLISPYFVPGSEGAALLEDLARGGVRVSVVTNSLAATDVVAVHGGYARYRERLLDAGVELHELKPSGEEGASVFGSRGASLHTKALVVDCEEAFVGSFNLDPRSVALNTEMGTFVRHPGIARKLCEEHARLAEPSRSWRVSRDGIRLAWTAEVGGTAEKRHLEPDASLSRRILAELVRMLPVESQL
ncbi:Phosphatidylserine/phosphatidylglycerophosphate/cardiolipin synthase [Roseomonas rosea]|uniref:Phospholipase D n=1 Tax=Muricoccus roseus TaxID=198092 RepID=A0A1M6MDH9_9PROT|nr:phospholipase D family protein [Roseomonas rosea]SHJ81497.1 Phosphatidylserine/phosphatidylglycerophosphate/cardiolipin synthase [Roseomonas rosea]